MQTHKNLIALAILSIAAFAAIPARASVTYSTSRFQITYPDGWQPLFPAVGPYDSTLGLMNQTLGAGSWILLHTTDHPMTAQELDAYGKTLAGADSTTKVSNGSQTLGGKSFIYLEYETVETSGKQRTRLYYLYIGSLLFTGLVTYDPSGGPAPQTEMESALATLNIPGTPIHVFAARTYPTLRPADHDVMGRARSLSARTWLFRLPAR